MMKKILTYISLASLIAAGIFIYDRFEKYNAYVEAKEQKETKDAREMQEINARIAKKLIPYKLLNKTINDKNNKLTLNIEVNIVNKRLPNAKELGKISNYIVRTENKHYTKTWVFFFLPGMKLNAGAFATAHHTPNMKVEILNYVIKYNYPQYKKYIK